MKIEIKCRFDGHVLFSHDAENNSVRVTLEVAVSACANLTGAYLAGAELTGAYLAGANLDGANLTGANLTGAYLTGAYLAGANLDGAYLAGAELTGAYLAGANLAGAELTGAYLAGANLDGANLTGANLDGAKLLGDRPILQIGPIGSRCVCLVAYITDAGVKIKTGCFFGTLAEFSAAVDETHGTGKHGTEYRAAITMIQTHADIWGKP